MRYTERKEFLYDTEVFKLRDTQIALTMYAEWVRISSPKPRPKFFEVNRDITKIDTLWHMPLTDRTTFTRELDVPVIAKFEKPNWKMTKLGIKPVQQFNFIIANLHLQPSGLPSIAEKEVVRLDYFPLRGDMIYYLGYRLMITNVVLAPEAYWGQTNVWMGLICEATIAPDGDARPLTNLGETAPAEKPTAPVPADWPGFPPTGPTNIPHNWP